MALENIANLWHILIHGAPTEETKWTARYWDVKSGAVVRLTHSQYWMLTNAVKDEGGSDPYLPLTSFEVARERLRVFLSQITNKAAKIAGDILIVVVSGYVLFRLGWN